ncbi:MAG TPA: hypothetical protein VFU05_14905 [Cyclobacteriaceae bacterium]|nr:hypothetical protein [Cyclobacteriaceae bacterium]
MKRTSTLLLLLLLCVLHSRAQIDTSFSIVRKNEIAKFSFTRYNKNSILQNYPVYTIEKLQIHRINMLLRSFVNNEASCDLLVKNYHQLDSVFKMKELHLTEITKTQELRVKNHEEAYQSLLTINTQLNQQLKNCKDLALSEHKKGKKKAALVGILAGVSAGLIIGIVVDP